MSPRSARGSLTVEAVLLAPALMALVMLVVLAHRQTEAVIHVTKAADAGARAASLSSPAGMESAGIRAARREMTGSGIGCDGASVRVNRSSHQGMETVAVTVSCRADTGGLGLLGVRGGIVSRTSVEVIDVYRGS